MEFDWDWDTAEREFRRAIELDPDSAKGQIGYGLYLTSMKRPREAMEYIDGALELDPFALVTTADSIMLAEFMSGEMARAIRHCEEAIELSPGFWAYYAGLSLALAQAGDLERAIEVAEEGRRIILENLERHPDDHPAALMYAALGSAYAMAGQEEDARKALAMLEELKLVRFICPYETATVHLALGEYELAQAKMCEAIAVRSPCIRWLGVDPRMEVVRTEAQFLDVFTRDERVGELMRRTGWERPK